MARVTEAQAVEIERTMFVISETRRRVERLARQLARDGAETHLVEALEEAERELDSLSLRLMQKTYFAVPKDQLTLT